MIALLIFFGVLIGLNCVPNFFRFKNPMIPKTIIRFSFYAFIIFIVLTVLKWNGISVKGIYTYTFFGLLVFVGCLFYFISAEYSKAKVIKVIVSVPVILFVFLAVYFGQIRYQTKLNNNYDLEVHSGGFMACGEHMYVTESFFGIFTEEVQLINGLCVTGINNVEVKEKEKDTFRLLIFHDTIMDSENPMEHELIMSYKL